MIFIELYRKPVKEQPEDTEDRLIFPPWRVKKMGIKIIHLVYNFHIYDDTENSTMNQFSEKFKKLYAVKIIDIVMKEFSYLSPSSLGFLHPRVVIFSIKFLNNAYLPPSSFFFSILFTYFHPRMRFDSLEFNFR